MPIELERASGEFERKSPAISEMLIWLLSILAPITSDSLDSVKQYIYPDG